MFGLGKKPLDDQQFNNIYISCFVRAATEGGRFPSAADLLVRIASVLPQMKAKLSPEQERSIAIIDSLVQSQRTQLIELSKKAAAEMPSGNRASFDSMADYFHRWAILTDPAARAFMNKYGSR